jgi:uncharacterized oxidoreductase
MTNPQTNELRLASDVMRRLMVDILHASEVPAGECEIIADVLLEASLSGYDSHGIMRIPRYVDAIRQGTMIPGAKTEILNETPASAHLDAGWGLGPVTATHAIRLAGDKARQTGIGCVSTTHSNDIARLGSYVLEPAQNGLIALIMVNDAGGGPSVVPWGGTQPFMSTNPLAAGIPREGEAPIVIDVSTGMVAFGKLRMHANRSEPVPEGWLIDHNGESTTDPDTFFAEPPQSALLPLGGLLAGYKGFALGLLVDILAGGLGGAGLSSGAATEREGNGIFAQVIDPAFFGSREHFTAAVETLVNNLKNSPKAPGVDEILIPGERAHRERQQRTAHGISIDGPTTERLAELLRELGLAGRYEMFGKKA